MAESIKSVKDVTEPNVEVKVEAESIKIAKVNKAPQIIEVAEKAPLVDITANSSVNMF